MKKRKVFCRIASFILVCVMLAGMTVPMAAEGGEPADQTETQDIPCAQGEPGGGEPGEESGENEPGESDESDLPEDGHADADDAEDVEDTEEPEHTDESDEAGQSVQEDPAQQSDPVTGQVYTDLFLTGLDLTGTGSEHDPYLVYSAEGLLELWDVIELDSSEYYYVRLESDFSLEDAPWQPIAEFNGHFGGNGKTISGLYNDVGDIGLGLFGSIGTEETQKTIIKDLTLSIHQNGLIGDGLIGPLAASAQNAELIGITVDGEGIVSGRKTVGGLVGSASGGLLIEDCTSTVTIIDNDTDIEAIGGLIGTALDLDSLIIRGSAYSGQMSLEAVGIMSVGGLIGAAETHEGSVLIEGSTFDGALRLEAEDIEHIGGIIGKVEALSEWNDTQEDLRIENVTIAPERFEIHSDGVYCVGGVLGFAQMANISMKQVETQGSIALHMMGMASHSGGLIGSTQDSFIRMEGITAGASLIITDASGEARSDAVGGAIGKFEYGQIIARNVSVNGDIQVLGQSLGGFVGELYAEVMQFENCTVSGSVTLAGGTLGGFGAIVQLSEFAAGQGGSHYLGLAQVTDDQKGIIKGCTVDHIVFQPEAEEDAHINYSDLGGFVGIIGFTQYPPYMLHVIDCSVKSAVIDTEGRKTTGDFSFNTVGGFFGYLDHGVNVTGCSTNLLVRLDIASDSGSIEDVGGFFGTDHADKGAAVIQNCHAEIDIEMTVEASEDINMDDVGGFSGYNTEGADYIDCYAIGDITLNLKSNDQIGFGLLGGFFGKRDDESNEVARCYYAGDITVRLDAPKLSLFNAGIAAFAGMIGNTDAVTDCYAAGNVAVELSGVVEHTPRIGGFIGIKVEESHPDAPPKHSYPIDPFSGCYYAGNVSVTGSYTGDEVVAALFSAAKENDDIGFTNTYYDLDRANGLSPLPEGDTAANVPKGVSTLSMTRENAHNPVLDESLRPYVLTGFDFENVWQTVPNNGGTGYYPQLRAFASSADAQVRAHSLQSAAADTAYHRVTVNGNGGTAEDEAQIADWYQHGETLKAMDFVDGQGNPVLSYNAQADGEGISYEKDVAVSADLTLYAIYEEEDDGGDGGDSGDGGDGGDGGNPGNPGGSGNRNPGGNNLLDKESHHAYITGYPDGTVRPQANLTREEAATVFFRLLTAEARADFWATQNAFTDVHDARWSGNAISTMAKATILKGYTDNTFRPETNITRAELAAIVARFESEEVSTSSDAFTDTESHWAQDEIARSAALGYVQGYPDGTFRPDAYITRAEVVVMLNRVLERHVDDVADLLEDMLTWSDNQDITAWYYFDIQEAGNSHYYERKADGLTERWTELRTSPDWNLLSRSETALF